MKFYKWHGAGNDFVVVISPENILQTEEIALLCNRRFGIGSDGFMVLRKVEDHHFAMDYYNADGKLGSLCGNGSRCAVAMAAHLGWITTHCTFLASDGPHKATIYKSETTANNYTVALEMHPVNLIRNFENGLFIDTGSPHWIFFRDKISDIDVVNEGRHYRHSPLFKDGVNVNFVEITSENQIAIRTYERGVEDETWACGTGVTAAALATAIHANYPNGNHTIEAKALGGQFKIGFTKTENQFTNILLVGPAQLVFEGEWGEIISL